MPYRVHIFDSSANLVVNSLGTGAGAISQVDYLLVAGGGGGGARTIGTPGTIWNGGGGGAGGLLQGTFSLSQTQYPVIIGVGGAEGPPTGGVPMTGARGSNSEALGFVAVGGGGGGGEPADGPFYETTGRKGSRGGSGGGGSSPVNGIPPGFQAWGGDGYPGQGFKGGGSHQSSGGGGGSGGVGGDGVSANASVGCGGYGTVSSITGTSNIYAAGGNSWNANSNHFSYVAYGTYGCGGTLEGSPTQPIAGPGNRAANNTGMPGVFIVRYPYGGVNFRTSASGGQINITGGYKIHTFTASGTFSVDTVGQNPNVEVLLVAGGGGGGSANPGGRDGGGGGGGGFLTTNITVVSGTQYTIEIGGGGVGKTDVATGPAQYGGMGGNTSAFGLMVIGGGGGAHGQVSVNIPGLAGGSGGGGQNAAGGAGWGFPGPAQQGFPGGSFGGGGAGGFGTVGSGGAGKSSDISGELRYYAGGGGGGATTTPDQGQGGIGGGGRSALNRLKGNINAVAGIENTGGGGGGGATFLIAPTFGLGTSHQSAAGGSGIVIIRYPYN